MTTRNGKMLAVFLIPLLIGCHLLACGDPNENERKQLTVYLDFYSINILNPAIDAFKSSHTDISIHAVDLSELTMEEYSKKVMTELMAGKGPDVICFHTLLQQQQDVYKMMASGAFMNLNPLLQENDAISLNSSVEAVMQAGIYEGKRYLLPASYMVPLIMTSKSNLEECGLNVGIDTTLEELTEQYGKYADRCKESGQPPKPLFGDPNAFGNAYSLLNMKAFDYENKIVNLNTPTFRAATEFNRYMDLYKRDFGDRKDSMTYRWATEGDQEKVFEGYFFPQERSFIAASAAIIAGYSQPVILPVSDSEGGVLAQPLLAFGIRNGCDNPHAAYEFIRTFFTNNFQDGLNDGISVRRGGMEIGLYLFTNSAYSYIAESPSSLLTFGPGGDLIDTHQKIAPLPEAFLDDYRVIESKIKAAQFDTPFLHKISNEMSGYVAGKENYETALKKAEDMAKIYISE